MLVQGIWATVLLAFAVMSERAYETVIDFFSFTSAVFNVLTFAAVWVLRHKLPEMRRPFRLWGFPYVLVLVLLIQLYFMVTTLITAFVPSMIGVALTLTGLIYYRWKVVSR